jgi:hypothetical protein
MHSTGQLDQCKGLHEEGVFFFFAAVQVKKMKHKRYWIWEVKKSHPN